MGIVIIRPNGDTAQNGVWLRWPAAGTWFSKFDEVVLTPDVPDLDDYIYISSSESSGIWTLEVPEFPAESVITAITTHVYAYSEWEGDTYAWMNVFGAGPPYGEIAPIPAGTQWSSAKSDGLALTPAQLASVWFRSDVYEDTPVRIYAAYVEVEYGDSFEAVRPSRIPARVPELCPALG